MDDPRVTSPRTANEIHLSAQTERAWADTERLRERLAQVEHPNEGHHPIPHADQGSGPGCPSPSKTS